MLLPVVMERKEEVREGKEEEEEEAERGLEAGEYDA